MSDAEFVVTYISNAIKNGLDAKESARNEILKIDERLSELEPLKVRRRSLLLVLDNFGDTSFQNHRTEKPNYSANNNVSLSDNKDLQEKIRKYIDEKQIVENVRDLINAVGGYNNDILVYRLIKEMGESEILSRDSDNRLIKGPNW